MDPEATSILAETLAEEGVELRFGAEATRVEGGGGEPFRLELEARSRSRPSACSSPPAGSRTSRASASSGSASTIEKKGIAVDERLSAADGVWAAGDVTGIAPFTHVGKYQGRIAAANVAGQEVEADYRAIPACIFTDPQVASAGDTSGKGVVTASWPLESVSRTATFQRPKRPGLVKLYADPERRVLVGATAVGPEAGEWIGQLTWRFAPRFRSTSSATRSSRSRASPRPSTSRPATWRCSLAQMA